MRISRSHRFTRANSPTIINKSMTRINFTRRKRRIIFTIAPRFSITRRRRFIINRIRHNNRGLFKSLTRSNRRLNMRTNRTDQHILRSITTKILARNMRRLASHHFNALKIRRQCLSIKRASQVNRSSDLKRFHNLHPTKYFDPTQASKTVTSKTAVNSYTEPLATLKRSAIGLQSPQLEPTNRRSTSLRSVQVQAHYHSDPPNDPPSRTHTNNNRPGQSEPIRPTTATIQEEYQPPTPYPKSPSPTIPQQIYQKYLSYQAKPHEPPSTPIQSEDKPLHQ